MSEDERYYLPCPQRKDRAKVPLTVCHKKKCMWLASDKGRFRCDYGDTSKILKKRVSRIEKDGVI